MSDVRATVNAIEWRSVFPVVFLLRAFGIAFRPSLIAVGAAGILLSCCGWWLGDKIFLGPDYLQREDRAKVAALARMLESPAPRWSVHGLEALAVDTPWGVWLPTGGVEGFGLRFVVPARAFFEPAAATPKGAMQRSYSLRDIAFVAFGWLWQLAVWSIAGGIIVRQTLVELASDEAPGVMESARFVVGRAHYYAGGALFPLLGVFLLALPVAALGLVMRAEAGVFIAGLLWLLVVLAGLASAWLLVGLALGWPLIWGAVSAEKDGDHFGAMSRMYAYVYQRPLHYVAYVALVVIVGWLVGWFASTFADTAINFGRWSAGWGSGREQAGYVAQELAAHARRDWAFGSGVRLIRGCENIVRALAAGVGASYFWASFAGVYLLMRKATDDKEMDEVYIDFDDLRPSPVEVIPPTAPQQPTTAENPPPTSSQGTSSEPPSAES